MSILIDVAAEFTGAKAFKQADSATDKLGKSVKSLAKTLGLTFGAAQVLSFAKASVKAAAADQKAQQQLALALQNVGLGRDAATTESYIQKLQSEFGIVDDKLRPAYQRLAVATGSTSESQKLLNLALDISAGTGKDLESVTAALSKAYLGSNTSLAKLGTGISKADLKTKSFNEVTTILAKTWKGAATTSANTFAGSMAKLGVASNNVQEIIGTGIIDAFTILSTDHTVDDLATSMENVALYTADVIRGIGVLTKSFSTLNASLPSWMRLNFDKILMIADPQLSGLKDVLDKLGAAGAKARRIAEVAAQKNPIQSGTYLNKPAVVKSNKTQETTQKKLLKSQQDAFKLAKAKAIFDLQKIEIEAALKGKISDEDKIRLKLMQAIEDENITLVEKYTKMLDEAQAKTKALQDLLNGVKGTALPNPFETWDLRPIKTQLDELDKYLMAFNGNMASAFATLTASQQALLGGYVPFVGATNASLANAAAFQAAQTSAAAGNTSNANTTIQVTVNGAVDPVATANQINQILSDSANQVGGYSGLGSGYKAQSYAI